LKIDLEIDDNFNHENKMLQREALTLFVQIVFLLLDSISPRLKFLRGEK
jgi:hypothetical protein